MCFVFRHGVKVKRLRGQMAHDVLKAHQTCCAGLFQAHLGTPSIRLDGSGCRPRTNVYVIGKS